MTKFKSLKTAASAAVCLAGIAATPAHAALTIDLSSLPSTTFGNTSVFCGATGTGTSTGAVSGTPASCSFTDTISFTTPLPYNMLSASITTIAVGGSGSTSDINFTSVILDGINLTLSPSGFFEFGSLANLAFLAPGNHTLSVSGTTYGTSAGSDGSYSGTITFAVVPEPATWLSMILGMAALGFTMRNRKVTEPKVRYVMG